ncbi:protoporphyrinogen oxidase HemJ [Pseudoxanthobacter soli]
MVMTDLYLWAKTLHIVSVVAWMAAMFYLPRLMVYHVAAERGSVQSETFKVMERRLLKLICNPAMISTWIFGLLLAWQGGFFADGWLHAKLALVLVLSGLHGFLSRCVKDFAADRNRRSARFYRIINEVPTVLLLLIVILVIFKPM